MATKHQRNVLLFPKPKPNLIPPQALRFCAALTDLLIGHLEILKSVLDRTKLEQAKLADGSTAFVIRIEEEKR